MSNFQRMNFILLDSKQQFNSIQLQQHQSQQLQSLYTNIQPLLPQQHPLSSSQTTTFITKLSIYPPNTHNLINVSQNVITPSQNVNTPSQNVITVPRCGKITHNNKYSHPQLKLNSNINTSQNNKLSLTPRNPIQYSGYVRYYEPQKLSNTNNNTFKSQKNTHNPINNSNQSTNTYNLTQNDINYLSTLRKQYKPKLNSYTLSTKTFTDIIVSCQQNYHKNKTINLQSSTSYQILSILEFNLPSKLTTLSVEQKKLMTEMFTQVIQYWRKVKVEKYKLFPMIRSLWPKTDLQQLKYSYFVPYKSRTLQKDKSNNKLPQKQKTIDNKNNNTSYSFYNSKNSTIRNKLGRTQRQAKINRQCRQLSVLYQQINKFKQENKSYRNQLCDKQLRRFHKLAEMYNLKKPIWYENVLRQNSIKNNNYFFNNKFEQITNQIEIFEQQPYYNYPRVRLHSNRSTNYTQWEVTNQYNASYNTCKDELTILSNGQQIKTQMKRTKRVKKSY